MMRASKVLPALGIFILLFAPAPLPSQATFATPLVEWTFRPGSTPWALEQKDLAATLAWKTEDLDDGHGPCARITVVATSEKTRNYYTPFALGSSNSYSHLRLTIRLLAENMQEGDMFFSILESAKTRGPRWVQPGEVLLGIPVGKGWTNVSVEAPISPDSTGLNVMVRVRKTAPAGATLRLEKASLEGLTKATVQFLPQSNGNIFEGPDGQVTLDLPPGKIREGQVAIFDEYGKQTRTIPLGDAAPQVAIPLAGKGYYQLDASITLENGVALTNRTTAAVIGDRMPDGARLASPFGFFAVRNIPHSTMAGGGWNRNFIWLPTIEKTGSGFTNKGNFPKYEKNQNWIGCLWFPPKWLMNIPEGVTLKKEDTHTAYPPNNWDDLAELAKYVALQVTNLSYLEVMNEPDAGNWKGTDAELVRYHTVIAKAVKSVRPDMKVLGPSLYSIRMPVLQGLAKLGLFEALDGLVVHAYVNGTPPEEDFIDRIDDLKKYLASIGKADFPIYITEFGWTTAEGTWQKPVDELTQARYAVRSMALLATRDIKAICYFCLLYQTANPGEHHFSILRSDQTPKPSYAAYAHFTRSLAGMEKKGEWVRLSPHQSLALFPFKDKTVAMAWDTRTNSALTVSTPFLHLTDMMGRDGTPGGPRVAIGQGPVFFDSPDPTLVPLAERAPITLSPYEDAAVTWTESISPDDVTLKGGRIALREDAPAGRYSLLVKVEGRWMIQPVDLMSPVQVVQVATQWPLGEAPTLAVDLRTFGKERVSPRLVVKLFDAPDQFAGPIAPKPNGMERFPVSLADFEQGRRYRGQLIAEYRDSQGRYNSSRKDLDVTLVSAALQATGASAWENIAPVDSSRWSPFQGSSPAQPFAAADCSARFKFAWGDTGLSVWADIEDDVHQQNKAAPLMWQGDSLQIGIDVDVDEPWLPNSWKYFNGHRIFEYGVALGELGPMNHRWVSYSELPGNIAEPRLELKVSREGKFTRYEVRFPWETLGLSGAPKRGSTLGIALAVNDSDGKPKDRHGLRLFGGLIESKDPTAFGKLYLR